MPVAKHRLDFSELIYHGAEQKKIQNQSVRSRLDDVLKDAETTLTNISGGDDGNVVESTTVLNDTIKHLSVEYLRALVLSLKMMKFNQSSISTIARYIFTLMALVEITMFISYEGIDSTLYTTSYALNIIVNIYFIMIGFLHIGASYAYVMVKYNGTISGHNVAEIIFHSGILEVLCGCFSLGHLGTRTGSWFDLIRIMLLSLAGLEHLPHIDVLMSGIFLGIESLASMWLMLIVVFFIYAACALTFFSRNDPFHFGSIAMSMWTFFEISTFDGWEKVLYMNMYGCDQYPSYYVMGEDVADDAPRKEEISGDMYLPICDHPEGRPLLAAATFVSFTLICGFILISLTVASVTGGIKDRLDELNESSIDQTKEEAASAALKKATEDEERFDSELAMKLLKQIWRDQDEGLKRKQKILMKRVSGVQQLANSPEALAALQQSYYRKHSLKGRLEDVWQFVVDPMSRSVAMRSFVGNLAYRAVFALAVIIGAFLEVWALQKRDVSTSVKIMQIFLQICYSADIICRLIAHYPHYITFFHDNWNIFDFALVTVTWVPFFSSGVRGSRYIGLLRVLRILRVLRLLTWIARLNIMLRSIATSLKALVYVIFLMCILFFHFAIAGVLLFDTNDPHHFGTIYRAFITLWQTCSLANWTFVARTQMYGCDLFGYDNNFEHYDERCVDPKGRGWLAAWFFIVFIVLAVMVLVNLFVGVIITSMELLKEGLKQEERIWELARKRQKLHTMKESSLEQMLEIFEMADETESATLTLLEVRKVLRLFIPNNVDQISLFMKVDNDNNGQLNFAEFVDVVQFLGEVYRNPATLNKDNEEDVNKIAQKKYMNAQMRSGQYAVLAAMSALGRKNMSGGKGEAVRSPQSGVAAAAYIFRNKLKKSASVTPHDVEGVEKDPEVCGVAPKKAVRRRVSFAGDIEVQKIEIDAGANRGSDDVKTSSIPLDKKEMELDAGSSEREEGNLGPEVGGGSTRPMSDSATTDDKPPQHATVKSNLKVKAPDDEHRIINALQTVRKLKSRKQKYMVPGTSDDSYSGDSSRRNSEDNPVTMERNIEALLTIRNLKKKKREKKIQHQKLFQTL